MVENDGNGEDRRRILRSVIAANRFMTLATADESGTPWATPVWFASPDGRRFLWVSRPTTRHSRNIAARPDVAIVIYDSQTTPDDRQAVYVEATAGRVADDRIDEGMETYARKLVSEGLDEWSRVEVTPPRRLRLYEAMATAHFILADATDERLSVTMD